MVYCNVNIVRDSWVRIGNKTRKCHINHCSVVCTTQLVHFICSYLLFSDLILYYSMASSGCDIWLYSLTLPYSSGIIMKSKHYVAI